MASTSGIGNRFILVDSTSARWPGDGQGSASAVATGPRRATLMGFSVKTSDAAASSVTVMKYDGTTTLRIIPVAGSATVGSWIELGDISTDDGFSVKTSTANTTGYLVYREII